MPQSSRQHRQRHDPLPLSRWRGKRAQYYPGQVEAQPGLVPFAIEIHEYWAGGGYQKKYLCKSLLVQELPHMAR